MKPAPKHPEEKRRLESLRALNILDTLSESDFDQITYIASVICGTPISLVSLVDENRQWFKSKVGLNAAETPRDLAFCAHAILQKDLFIVNDSTKDERFADNPLVTGAPNVKFYAGAPLLSPDGYPIGTVCVIDSKPRTLSSEVQAALLALSNQVTRLLELRLQITDLKNAENQKKTMEAQLVDSARLASLGEMSAGIAHEINNPLAVIKGKTDILKMRLEAKNLDLPAIGKDVDSIANTVDRIAKIIKALRSYSRNAENDPLVQVNIGTVIEDTLELCKERFNKSNVEIRYKRDKNFPVNCRPTQISQVLMNLLGNAFDAVSALQEKWVEITVLENEKEVLLYVKDSGAGIPDMVAKKMMQPFYTTKEIGKGTGLGLSISSGIMESHCGHLKYLSSEKNTTFLMSLPKLA